MKILLLTPPFSLEERYGGRLKGMGPMLFPPLGLSYIAAVLEKDNHEVEIIDASLEGLTKEDIAGYISNDNFEAIGLYVMTPAYKRCADVLKSIRPVTKAPIIVGGPHPSILPKDTLEDNEGIDYAVYGEGEVTIVELIRTLEDGGNLRDVKGIAHRENGNIIINPPRDFIKDLDTIPFPARHLVKIHEYIPAPSSYRSLPATTMIVTRGCPFKCIYCSSQSIFGRRYRTHSVPRVIAEIEHLINEYKIREIFFFDDLFTIRRDWVMNLCDELIKRKINKKVGWSCDTRVNLVDLELLKKMKKAGCWSMHFGVETASPRLLKLIDKGIEVHEIENAFKLTRKVGMETRGFFMLGLPTETREESIETINFAKRLNPDYAKFLLTTPYPGTRLFDMVRKSGELKTFDWEKYRTMGVFIEEERPYVPKGRTSEELRELHKRAHREFFLRPSTILNHLFKIRSFSVLKMYFRVFKTLLKL